MSTQESATTHPPVEESCCKQMLKSPQFYLMIILGSLFVSLCATYAITTTLGHAGSAILAGQKACFRGESKTPRMGYYYFIR